jgi:hypothetical protein
MACSDVAADCATLPFAPGALSALEDGTRALDWEPVLPCAYTHDFLVESARVTGASGEAAVTFTVVGWGERRFAFSQAGTAAGGTAIPIGTRRVSLDVSGVAASGYEGGTGSGGTMLYLRWETSDGVFEYQASITARFPRAAAYRTARGLMERTAQHEAVDPGRAASD